VLRRSAASEKKRPSEDRKRICVEALRSAVFEKKRRGEDRKRKGRKVNAKAAKLFC